MALKTQAKARAPTSTEKGTRAPSAAKTDVPLYVQVSRTLKEEIVGGAYPVGSQLPTEDELCGRFSVSRYTVREALRRLRDDGLVASRQGAGTVVIPPRISDSYVLHGMSINDLVAFAHGTRFTIDSIKMVPVDGKLAAHVGVAAGDEWLAVCGLRHAQGDDVPVCWTEYYINRDYAGVARLLQRHDGPIFPLIEDLFAIRIEEVHQEIAAMTIPAAWAAGLKVKAGAVALEVRRTYRLADGTIPQITINTHPATRFRHSMTMRRMKSK